MSRCVSSFRSKLLADVLVYALRARLSLRIQIVYVIPISFYGPKPFGPSIDNTLQVTAMSCGVGHHVSLLQMRRDVRRLTHVT